ncbi:Predicted DNA-binding protein, MmcQ/YjbR family [bacterium A37T11]|nr:Predicted DNA-binding protein, MmcQ/YjbR family [bacterium A37T11]
MDIEQLREYCLNKAGSTESMPFGNDTLVFKVGEKIFLLVGLDQHPIRFNVKCDPDLAPELREQYPYNILPGYHMNKKHWNTIVCNKGLPEKLSKKMIDDSYELVLKSLPAVLRKTIKSVSP